MSDIYYSEITDTGLKNLLYLTNLKQLQIATCYITDSGIQIFTSLITLEFLKIHASGQITNDGTDLLIKNFYHQEGDLEIEIV